MESGQKMNVALSAQAGRVTTFTPFEGDTGGISQVKILSQGVHGHVSVNADQSLSLVLSKEPGRVEPLSFDYEITFSNGKTQLVTAEVAVTPPTQLGGWGQGNFYMLEEGTDGRIVVEHGDNHRKVHVTGSIDGLTREAIAAIEGVTPDKITAKWLAQRPEYGATPEKALSTGLGMELWSELTVHKSSSHWLLFERGHDYAGTGRLISRGAEGESELHPIYVGAYGEGEAPRLSSIPNIYQSKSQHVVIEGLELNSGFQALTAGNLLLNEITLTGTSGLNIQNVDGFTFRNSSIFDVVREAPVDGGDYWHPSLNRAGGAFIKNTNGTLIENTFSDRNGWAEGYDYNMSADSPMPPSMYSHNYYFQRDNLDVTFRDNIVMRAASFGAQFRMGGVLEDNVFIDNNGAVNPLDGGAGSPGNFTLMLDNIITSAGHKRVAQKEGALSMGVESKGQQASLIGNIVAHLADPNNPAEFAQKTIAHGAHNVTGAAYDDTIVFNWVSSSRGNGRNTDRNTDGLDRDVLNATTIQNFTAQILGTKTATIGDLADLLRGQAGGALDHVVDADLIVAFFRQGFGLEVDVRSLGATLRFEPNTLGDGMRWDNRLNWSTGDLPGTGVSDSVDLGGNDVLFSAKTVTVDDFTFGDHGRLTATSGRLNIAGEIKAGGTGAQIKIERAGQVWIDGYTHEELLEILLGGGRFANTGDVSGTVSVTAGGNGQALLATAGGSFDIREGSSLTVQGTKGKVGFDGSSEEAAVLRMHDGGALKFVASAEGLGRISEFRSGAFGEASAVTSGIRLDGSLSVDLAKWNGAAGGSWTLIKADQIVGKFDSFAVSGLAETQDAILRVDYGRDQVTLVVGSVGSGSGRSVMEVVGEESFLGEAGSVSMAALWSALSQMSSPVTPAQPAPVPPVPVEPAPAEPAPVPPAPVEPAPAQPAPVTPTPTPAPVAQEPVAPEPVSPVQPAPAVPAPVQPEPAPVAPKPAKPVPAEPGQKKPTPAGPKAGDDKPIKTVPGKSKDADGKPEKAALGAGKGAFTENDTVHASSSHKLAADVANLVLTGMKNLKGTGNALDNRITGNAGNNVLDGGLGADTMTGGRGNDIYIVDDAGDRVIERKNGGIDTVHASISYKLGKNVENLVLTGTDDLKGTGNALDNVITGNSGNNILNGGRGADTMIGGLGDDTYIVNSAKDRVIEKAGEGIDTVRASVSHKLAENVENLVLTGTKNLSGTGNGLDNVLTGNDGRNVLNGAAGDDWLIGGLGKDILTGGSGADLFIFLSRQDSGPATRHRDVITDFSRAEGDKIDLSAIDANELLDGNQEFLFIGQDKFSGSAGELRYEKVGKKGIISADLDGNGTADFAIELARYVALDQQDFLL